MADEIMYKKMLPNILSLCRIGLSLALLYAANRPICFIVLYLLCGLSDTLDGTLARKWHAESKLGAKLDSLGDLVFWAVVFYLLFHAGIVIQPYLLWIIAAVILLRVVNAAITRRKFHQLGMIHTYGNKAVGLLLYLLLPVCHVLKSIPVAVGLILGFAALLSAIEECVLLLTSKEYNADLKSLPLNK